MIRALYIFFRDRAYHPLMALFAAIVYRFPSRELVVIGITGTKGKSTVVELIAHILESSGNCAVVSSSLRNASGMTMPGRFFLQRLMRQGIRSGATHAVIEVTSQGVLQSRHRFIRFAVAACTNLAPEHVEAHGSFDKYRDAKVSFFSYAAAGNPASVFVVNASDPHKGYFIRAVAGHSVTQFSASSIASPLLGGFNAQNVGAALAISAALDIPDEAARLAVANFPGVSGRMEIIQKDPFPVIVDYAVTPDSLRAAFEVARSAYPDHRIISVFGCTGGGRDAWKRPVMGGIAEELSDVAVFTDDDSYDEDTRSIIRDIEGGISSVWQEGRDYFVVPDRRAALMKAISLADSRSLVIVSGKGGDQWLRMARGKKIPWSDQSELRSILAGTVPAEANPIP